MRAQFLDSMDLEREAGHHDQGPERAPRVERLRRQPDRHAGSRRLQLRGEPQPRRVRRRDPARRRVAGHRGADARELPTRRSSTTSRSSPRSTRSTCRPRNRRSAPRRSSACSASRREVLHISAKTGEGVAELLDAVIERIPAPTGDIDAPLQALMFDSYYDAYRGVVSSVRVVQRRAAQRCQAALPQRARTTTPRRSAFGCPVPTPVAMLGPGEVGYLIAGIKDVGEAKVGETVTDAGRRGEPLAATAIRSRWCSAVSIPSTATSTPTSARRWNDCGSTTRRSPTSPRPRARSASASAAGSSASSHGDRPGATRA